MCQDFDFPIVILGVIFDTFFTSLGHKDSNIDPNYSQFSIKLHFKGLFWMKSCDFDILADFIKFRSKELISFYKNWI